MQPLPLSVRRLWHLLALTAGGAVLLALGAADVLLRRSVDQWPLPLLAVPLVAAAAVAGVAWLWASLLYRSWRFELTDTWFQARWGVLNRYCATVPRNRVQTLTSHNGPLDRLLGLTSVTVHTAGAGAPNLSIPHLKDATVDWLRTELARGPLS
jgi:uncharacterized protein